MATSLLYLLRDIVYATVLVGLALRIDEIPSLPVRIGAWLLYMFAQGCVGTGLWILGHECGHGAFSKHETINNCLGWVIHSSLLVPFFSWKITHARHHRYTGHITKDAVFVPQTEEELKENPSALNKLMDLAEETSIVTVLRLLQHQLIGWQIYLFFNATAGKASLPNGEKPETFRKDMSHFTTSSRIFLPSQKHLVLISDLGLAITLGLLYVAAQYVGYQRIALLYFGPYFWVHHWLGKITPVVSCTVTNSLPVAITYLHHTHPDVPFHTDETWTYTLGALGTIDRTVGFIGRHFFHDIIDYHLVHHLFSRIPFYHAEEATKAILPLLGERYVAAKDESFMYSLYTTFKSCNFVGEKKGGGRGVLWWKIGRVEGAS